MPTHFTLVPLFVLTAALAFLATRGLLRRFTPQPGRVAELHAGEEGGPARRTGLTGLLPRLLGRGDLSSTRFVFLGAFGVVSFVLGMLFATLCWRFLRTGTTDVAMCTLAATSLGAYIAFATQAQNTKHKADAAAPTPPDGQ